jgi:hypothetical protein
MGCKTEVRFTEYAGILTRLQLEVENFTFTLPVCPHVTIREPLNGLSRNVIMGFFFVKC